MGSRVGAGAMLTGLEPWREHRWLPIPKGLRPKARGCEARATPGRSCIGANPNGVAPAVRNPVGVVNSRNLPPGVGPRRGPTPGFGTESRWDSRMGRRRDDEDADRFMGSFIGAGAMLTDHEPGKIPGGETPPSTAGGTPAATDARFMERRPKVNGSESNRGRRL